MTKTPTQCEPRLQLMRASRPWSDPASEPVDGIGRQVSRRWTRGGRDGGKSRSAAPRRYWWQPDAGPSSTNLGQRPQLLRCGAVPTCGTTARTLECRRLNCHVVSAARSRSDGFAVRVLERLALAGSRACRKVTSTGSALNRHLLHTAVAVSTSPGPSATFVSRVRRRRQSRARRSQRTSPVGTPGRRSARR